MILIIEAFFTKAELEMQRLAEHCNYSFDELKESHTRGTSVPTSTWDVYNHNKYPFTGHKVNSTLYLDYLIVGSLAYEVSCTNLYDHTSISYVTHGNKTGSQTISIPASTTVIKYFGMNSENDKFYLSFPPSAWFEGYVDAAFGFTMIHLPTNLLFFNFRMG